MKRFKGLVFVLVFMLMGVCFIGCATESSTEDVNMPEAEQAVAPAEPVEGEAPAGAPAEGAAAEGAAAGGPPAAPAGIEHETEFSVITLGTGSPMPNLERASACTIVQYKGQYYVVDLGNAVNNNFVEHNIAFKNINAIMFTHLHMDHCSDFFDVMTNRFMTGGKEMLMVGPPRTGDLYEFLTDFFYDDVKYRQIRGIARGIDNIGMFEGVEVKEIIGGDSFEIDGITVTTAELTHTQYDIGYRFDVDGMSIVVSGDTSFDEDLITLAKDADILVMDGSLSTEQETEGAAFTDDTIEKPEPKYSYSGNFEVSPHPTLDGTIQIAIESNVKKIVLTHMPPRAIDEEATIASFKDAGFEGEVVFAQDGMEFSAVK